MEPTREDWQSGGASKLNTEQKKGKEEDMEKKPVSPKQMIHYMLIEREKELI